MSESEIKAKIEEVDSILRMLEERKSNLLKALEALKMTHKFDNRFDFNPPIPKDAKPLKNFLIPRVLEIHKEKHGIQYWISESNNLVSSIEFSKCNDERKREIIKACEWVQKVLAQKPSD
ncbi:MAG: hypothetical protein QXD42_05075 [Nitrososphaerales archaeon]